MTGKLIVVEGTDGAGKSTLSQELKTYFELQNYPVLLLSYPDYESIWGTKIRAHLDHKITYSALELYLLFTVDIMKDQAAIRECLQNNNDNVVILDRYFYSTIAYQCAQGLDIREANNRTASLNLVAPDLVIYLKTSLEVAQHRRASHRSLDRNEADLQLQERVTEIYDNIFEHHQACITLQGDQPLTEQESEQFHKRLRAAISESRLV